MPSMRMWRVPAAMLLVVTAGCDRRVEEGSVAAAAPGADGAPILLVTLDTTRADHFSLFGYERDTTPFLEELARESVVFDAALAQSSWTLPSMLSLFSGLDTPALGVHDGVRPAPRGRRGGVAGVEVERFSESHPTLTEALQKAGYETAGISTNGHLIERQGFSQGFDRFDETSCMWGTAACAFEVALAELERFESERHLLWVHLFDPHFDKAGAPPIYRPPAGYGEMFGDEELPDPVASTKRDYDRKLRATDDSIRRFFAAAAERVDLDRYLVVLVGDHGEEFDEKGRWGHSKSVTNALVRVPLMIRLPAGAEGGRRIDDPVRLIDVAPTILDLIGLEAPEEFHGTSLAAALEGGRVRVPSVYGETRRSERSLHYWLDAERRLKLVEDRVQGRRWLFDFERDPDEEHDLAAQHPEIVAELAARLDALLEALDLEPGSEPEPLDEEARERLEALGYL